MGRQNSWSWILMQRLSDEQRLVFQLEVIVHHHPHHQQLY